MVHPIHETYLRPEDLKSNTEVLLKHGEKQFIPLLEQSLLRSDREGKPELQSVMSVSRALLKNFEELFKQWSDREPPSR